jgi:hypothetical protein
VEKVEGPGALMLELRSQERETRQYKERTKRNQVGRVVQQSLKIICPLDRALGRLSERNSCERTQTWSWGSQEALGTMTWAW